jgi:hypothetical protein
VHVKFFFSMETRAIMCFVYMSQLSTMYLSFIQSNIPPVNGLSPIESWFPDISHANPLYSVVLFKV